MEFASPERNLPLKCALFVFLILPRSDVSALLISLQLLSVDLKDFSALFVYVFHVDNCCYIDCSVLILDCLFCFSVTLVVDRQVLLMVDSNSVVLGPLRACVGVKIVICCMWLTQRTMQ